MKVSALLSVAAAITMLSLPQSALCQTDQTQLTVKPSTYTYDTLYYQTKGLIGSSVSGPSTLRGSKDTDDGPSVPGIQAPGFYPDDVTNPGDHATVFAAKSHPLYVDAYPSTWGKVGEFLTDFGQSDFVHVLDQYVGSYSDNRYTLGTSFLIGYPLPTNNTLQIDDLLAIVHAGASVKGGGLGHIYHVFLPPGVDTCFPPSSPGATPQCYSPDNPSTFYFCAYHSAVTFSDSVGHVIFTVEPYQKVLGCETPPTGTANSQLIDSTDDVLSHEMSELISDPNLNAWWVHRFTFANGNEIGDMCTRAAYVGQTIYSHYGNVNLNGHLYTIQPEYSNRVHGCTYSPTDGD